jgi:hypothetical protein
MFGLFSRPKFQGISPQFIWPTIWYSQSLHVLDPEDLPSISYLELGKSPFSRGKSPFLLGKSTISMAMLNSKYRLDWITG